MRSLRTWWRDLDLDWKLSGGVVALLALALTGFLAAGEAEDASYNIPDADVETREVLVNVTTTVKGKDRVIVRSVPKVRTVVREGVTAYVTGITTARVTLPGLSYARTLPPVVRREVVTQQGRVVTAVRTVPRVITNDRTVTDQLPARTVTNREVVTDTRTETQTQTQVITNTVIDRLTITDTRTVTDVVTETTPAPPPETVTVTVTTPKPKP